MAHNKMKNNGFTLLETLLALSVISVGVMAAFTLSTANLNTAKANYQRVLAANLAREGVEIVRNIRDSNWLKIQSNFDCDTVTPGMQLCTTWDSNLDENKSIVDPYNSWDLYNSISFGNSVEDCFNHGDCRLKKNNLNSINHVSGVNTNMARLIILKDICRDTDGNEPSPDTHGIKVAEELNACGGLGVENYEEKIGLQVTSQVYWQDFSKSHTIEVVEELYNWREYEN